MKIILIAIMLMPLMALADTEIVNGITWTFTISDGKASVGGGNTSSPAVPKTTRGEIVIPPTLGGKSVTTIGNYAFSGCTQLTSVVIPTSVTSIGSLAFSDCSGLTSVTIPTSVTNIDGGAFCGCSGLESMTLPFVGAQRGYAGTVASLFGYVFGSSSYAGSTATKQYYSSSTYSIASSVTYYIPSSLKTVVITDESIIVYGAFYGCRGIESVTIPSSTTRIDDYAFYGCSELTSVTIPSSVTRIGFGAFSGTPFYDNQPDGMMILGSVFYKYKGNSPSTVSIPEGVTQIGASAFSGCSGLTSVTMPLSVTSIEASAFSGCSGLTSVTIPSSVTNIEGFAFRDCSRLTSVMIPTSVTSIGSGAFCGCSGLESMTLPFVGSCRGNAGAPESLFGYIFGSSSYPGSTSTKQFYYSSVSSHSTYYIPSSLKTVEITDETIIGYGAFSGCSGLTSVSIPESVMSIGKGAFCGCSGLVSMTLPFVGSQRGNSEMVESVFGYIFGTSSYAGGTKTIQRYSVSLSLTQMSSTYYIPSSLRTVLITDESVVGYGAFSGCSGLTSVSMPTSVTRIDDYAFSGCNGLTVVTIPEGVTDIGDYVFSSCEQLRSVTIPSGVAYIGFGAFATGSTLDKVVVSDLESYASIRFADAMANPRNNAETLYVGEEPRNEMCTVSYRLATDDMREYMWYAEFSYYGEAWTISDYGQTASCEVPIGSTIDFYDLSKGAITISEWGDRTFDGWEGDGACVISSTEVVARWKAKSLPEVVNMLSGYGSPWGKQQYLFLDANSGCYRSQGTFHFGTDPSMEESSSYITEILTQTGQLFVRMVGYDENYHEVIHTQFPVVMMGGEAVWSGELTETNRVRYIALQLAHSFYEGTCDLYDTGNNSTIWIDVQSVEVRFPMVHYIYLEGANYNCYDHKYGSYDIYNYKATMDGKAKSGDVLSVSLFGGWYGREEWRNNDFMAVSIDPGQGFSSGDIYSSDREFSVSSFTWIIPSSSQEQAREPRTVVFATRVRDQRSWHDYRYEIDVAPDIITHQVVLNYGLRCDLSQMDDSMTNQIVDDGLVPTFPRVYPLPGWRFVGWVPGPDLPVSEDVEYIAQYKPISYSITFENVKECENANTNAYTVEDGVVFSALPDLPDWHFDGWSPAKIDVGTTGDVTVTALWRPIETAEIVGTWSEPQTFEYDGKVHGVDYSARLDVMDWSLNVVTQGTIRAVNVGEYAATARAETVGVPETDTVYYRCAAVTNDCRWTITPKPVTKLQITYVSTAMIANGQPQTPQIVVRDVERGVVLTAADYTLAYENNVKPGRGVARITGKGNYGGETMIEFPIVAKVSPSEGLNMDDSTFEIVGETDWVADNVETHDGYASMRSGTIGDGETSALTSVVHGAGTVSFWWKVSSQRFDSVLELDRLEFYIDGERQKWINGDTSWAKLSYKVEGAGPHELKWVYVKDGSVSERQDCGWVDEVTWEKDWLIGDWLNDVDREFTTGDGDSLVKWLPDSSVSADGVGSMRSGACQQGERSVLSTVVENAGELTFKWKSSCVAYGDYVTDKLSLLVDGVPAKDKDGKDIFVNGQTDWRDVSYRISGVGRHEVQWVFEKVSDASMGEDCGWVDVVRWNGEPGTLTDDDLVVDAFDGIYDGQGHGVSVSVKGTQGALVKYGASSNDIVNAESPMFADCGEHEVWFAVNVPEFYEYVGKAVVRIQPRSIESGAVTLGASLVYTGSVLTQTVSSVTVDGLAATFEVSDNEAREAGAYQLSVTGTGNFCGTKSVPFAVAKAQASLKDVTVEGVSSDSGAVEFTYDGKVHLPNVIAAYDPSATVRFALSEDGPFADELGVSNAVERLDVWYEITSSNYARQVGQTRMTIHPLSIAGAEVVLGEQVSDAEGHVVQLVDSVIVDGLSATFDVANNVAAAEGDFELTVLGTGNFTGEAKCPYSVGGIVLPPVMTPGDGAIITNSLTVYVTAQTQDSKCYYTLDGSMPTTNSLTARRVNLRGKTTIRAMAVLDGKLRSAVVEAHYAFGICEKPKIRLDGLEGDVFHFPEQLVVIDCEGEEGVVRYTVDGSEPTAESPAYKGPFAISETTTVRAKAFSDVYFDSEPVTVEMRLEVLSVPSPVIEAKSEYVGTRTTVSMSCALDGAVVRYTLDGTDPTAASTLYEGPVEIGGALGSSVSVKARAFREHYADSPVAEAIVTRVWGVGDTLGVPDMTFETDGWVVDPLETFEGRESMRSGPTGDGETKTLEAAVQGGGTISFFWRTSCEDSNGEFKWDRAEFWVDDECVAKLEGEKGWRSVSHEVPVGGGRHRLRWLYAKDPDPDTSEGEDCAWIAALSWMPKEGLPAEIVVYDPNGKITLPPGKDVSEVKVRVMRNGHDIFPHLKLPAAVNGVIDLAQATVKDEVVREVLDPEEGAVIELNATNPVLTTAPTKPGLVYTFREGTSLEGLGAKVPSATKVGDGEKWTPEITVKGGCAAFYSIGVGKGEP